MKKLLILLSLTACGQPPVLIPVYPSATWITSACNIEMQQIQATWGEPAESTYQRGVISWLYNIPAKEVSFSLDANSRCLVIYTDLI